MLKLLIYIYCEVAAALFFDSNQPATPLNVAEHFAAYRAAKNDADQGVYFQQVIRRESVNSEVWREVTAEVDNTDLEEGSTDEAHDSSIETEATFTIATAIYEGDEKVSSANKVASANDAPDGKSYNRIIIGTAIGVPALALGSVAIGTLLRRDKSAESGMYSMDDLEDDASYFTDAFPDGVESKFEVGNDAALWNDQADFSAL